MNLFFDPIEDVEQAAKVLAEHGWRAMDLAVMKSGGPAKVAEKLGISPQRLAALLFRPAGQWQAGLIQQLAECSELPMDLLCVGVLEDSD
jgi:hypothetical protein